MEVYRSFFGPHLPLRLHVFYSSSNIHTGINERRCARGTPFTRSRKELPCRQEL